mgnify:CR=1 FL=1
MEVGSASDKAGRLEVRPEEHAALVDRLALDLSVGDFHVLVTLLANPQRILSREELHASV